MTFQQAIGEISPLLGRYIHYQQVAVADYARDSASTHLLAEPATQLLEYLFSTV
ncbi:hypothetical protein AB6846_27835 [Serratia proteamaculans]